MWFHCYWDYETRGVALTVYLHFSSSGLNLKNMSAIKNLPSSDIIGVKFNVQYISFYLIIIYIPFNTFFAVYNELFDTLSMLDYLYGKNII